MVMQATVPRNQPQRFDSVFTLACTPGRPHNNGKISSTGLYIKYYPGPKYPSLLTVARHKCTYKYASARNSTDFFYNKTGAKCLTGSGIASLTGLSFQKPPPYRDKYQSGTDTNKTASSSTKTMGASLRKEHYEAFRKPPPTRDKFEQVLYRTVYCTTIYNRKLDHRISSSSIIFQSG